MRLALVAIVALALVGCEPTGDPARPTLLAHHFDRSAEGWRIAADTVDVDPTHHPEGGDPGGYISGTDEAAGEIWYFVAPPSVLAQLPGAEGGALRYSLKQSEPTAGYLDDDVVIQGPAGRLSYRFSSAPDVEWTEFSVPLSASAGWRWNWNADATEEQMRRVLREPTRLHIRGEYVPGPDEAGLDGFVLSGRP